MIGDSNQLPIFLQLAKIDNINNNNNWNSRVSIRNERYHSLFLTSINQKKISITVKGYY